MANNRTVNLLPQVFQSDTNKKFLNATLDQLVSTPDFVKINGYVGRKFAPTTKQSDFYLQEATALRQNYQLEPSVIVKNKSGDIEFFGNYIDLLQQIEYYGGNISNHDRLFNNDSYNYNGLFDYDKFVNFNHYYWLPNGPDTVPVVGTGVAITDTITVTRDTITGSYKFSSHTGALNPELILAYGGTYQFIVDQPGFPFWLQIETGTNGLRLGQPNTSSRELLGVVNNGADVGTITFNVPLPTAQDNFIQLNLAYDVDIAVDVPYSSIQGMSVNEIISSGGLDGITTNLANKRIIFVGAGTVEDDTFWIDTTVFDSEPVPLAERFTVWNIKLIDDGNGNQIIDLVAPTPILTTEKVFVRSGLQHANSEYRIDSYGYWSKIPLISSTALFLYYQDGFAAELAGRIKLIPIDGSVIDINEEILGKTYYKSPNNVIFTNGLKVSFDSQVIPSSYADREFYIEGVGSAISLTPVDQLSLVGNYIEDILVPDYVTINRASLDRNAWARTNRWFHIDVINSTAAYLNTLPTVSQSQRAERPIIEFEENLQLINHGVVAKDSVDILELNLVTDALAQVENYKVYNAVQANLLIGSSTLTLRHGDKIIFGADQDPVIAGKIYNVGIVDIDENILLPNYRVHLTEAVDGLIEVGNTVWADTVITSSGTLTNTDYWFTGAAWNKAQQKTGYNQSPLFDIFVENNTSLSTINGSTFTGTKIFSYKTGTGRIDSVLGFPLSYRNFQNVGDIQFSNDFDNDTYQYIVNREPITELINNYFIRQNIDVNTYTYRNVWTKNKELTKQYQFFNYTFTGETNYFVIDVLPDTAYGSPNIIVYKNNGKVTDTLADSDYSIVEVNGKNAVRVNINSIAVGDILTIKIYSKTVSKIGYYEVPENLDLNSLNNTFTTLTLGQIRNHLVTISHNNTLISGTVPGDSNLRDLSFKDSSGSILQHASPVIYSNLFLLDKDINFVKSIEYAQKEYTKFKNKFLELAVTSGQVDINNIPNSVDTLLSIINSVKNSTFPWYYSDMVPYGNNIQPLNPYQILDPEIRQYEIPTVFVDTELSDRAVSVYYAVTKKDTYGELILDSNNQPIITEMYSLVKGKDYYFNQDRPAVTITDQVAQIYNDLIVIKDYVTTDGSFIPETPTKLGLYPKFVPSIFNDDTYVNTVLVIQGHDGSITPSFGDYRDQLLLELELRIYNNIKVNYDSTLIDIYDFLPGKFRTSEYDLTEFNSLLSTTFLKWVGSNKVDYTNNKVYNSNNPFTWNYKNFKSTVDGSQLPGSWRAIFKYYYDTDRPHLAPWEMLGFSEKPTWWEGRYGAAPYTGGNLVLWADLSLGYIYGENRYDQQFARPALLNIIPVDDGGNLRSPDKFLVANFNGIKTNASFAIGDIGPTENAWRRSSDYPFALQQVMALMKPGFYFGTLMNVDNYNVNPYVNQLALQNNLQRITPSQIKINGLVNGARQQTVGYVNWVGDYLTNLGISPGIKIINALNNLSVQLSYKVAGFTGKNYLKVLAEQSSPTSTNQSVIIPDTNYNIFLNKSTPIKKINYSAVIVQRSGNGWTVSGYDTQNPFFTIIPSLANNNAARIQVGSAVGIIYQDFQSYKIRIPYGYEFNTRQQVVDFLISYGRYLTGQGMKFNSYQSDLESVQDWTLSSREFLSWSQQGWRSGSILVLSPIINQIDITSANGVVDYIENSAYGSKILDQDSNVIKNTEFTVVRYGNDFKLTANAGQTIGFAQLNIVQYEHALIFDNTTIFNDIIYTPELGNRQYRLKLVGNRTGSWTGHLDIPGFIYNSGVIDEWVANTDYRKGSLISFKNNYYIALNNLIGASTFVNNQWQQIPESQIKTGLLNNFNYNAFAFENIYDINNQPPDQQINKFSKGLIGFRERSYLSDLGLDVETQSKFYQGFIKQKGTRNAVDALNQVALNNIDSTIETFEEWALRVGEYGSIDSNSYLEIILDEQKFNSDPETFVLLNNGETAPDQIIGVPSNSLYHKPNQYSVDLMNYREAPQDIAIPITAGYVNLADVDATLYDIQNYTNLNTFLDNIGSGYKIWVAKDFVGDWNVYRVSETDNYVTSITYALNGLALITTYNGHSFSIGDVIAIKGLDLDFDGFYRVFELADYNSFYVVAAKNATLLQTLETVAGPGLLFKLTSLRATDSSAISNLEPLNNWKVGDTIWADNDSGSNQWAVYKKYDVWTSANVLGVSESDYQTNSGYGSSVALSKNASTAIVGYPTANVGNPQGKVSIFHQVQTTGAYLQELTIHPVVTNVVGTGMEFGKVIDIGDRLMAIAAPAAQAGRGLVFVYNFDTNYSSLHVTQVISVPEDIIGDGSRAGDQFGTSISMSSDDRWLYVSAPYQGTGNVYAYEYTQPAGITTTSGNLVIGRQYQIGAAGSTDFRLLGASDNLEGTTFIANSTGKFSSGDLVVNNTYVITSTGSTNFTLLGALSNSVGTVFIANNSGLSTANNFVTSESYTIVSQGTTDFTVIGSAPSAVFTANVTGNILKVWSVTSGSISENCTLKGTGITSGTHVTYQLNGTAGGIGEYLLSDSFTLANAIIQTQPVIGTTFTANAVGSGTGTARQGTGNAALGNGTVFSRLVEEFDTTRTVPGITDLVYTLNVIPDNVESITVTLGQKVFIGNIDYTYDSITNEITFLADPGWPARVQVRSEPYYKLIKTFTPPSVSGVSYVNWGKSLKTTTDGRQLVIGDPNAIVNGLTDAGVATVYNRIVESFIADGNKNTFTPNRTLPANKVVIIDGSYKDLGTDFTVNDNSIQFIITPARSELVQVEINDFDLVKTLGLDEVTKQSNFAKSLDICNLNCSIYVGSPNYNRPGYFAGRVYRYVNQGRVYGTIASTKTNPILTQGHSIFINGIEVVFSEYVLSTRTTAIGGQTEFTTDHEYQVGLGQLNVYKNGVELVAGVIETGTNTFTLTVPASVGDIIRSDIHGYATVDSIVVDINNAIIPGVSAQTADGKLIISSGSTVQTKLLEILPGTGTSVLDDLGFDVLPLTQAVEHPGTSTGQRFGEFVHVSDTAGTLFVTSYGATSRDSDVWDNELTTVDRNSTTFDSRVKNSGTVFVYDYINNLNDSVENPAQFSFVKELTGSTVTENANFGSSIYAANGVLLIGASTDSASSPTAGEVYVYNNDTNAKAWQVIRSYLPKVDTSNLNRMFLYNKTTQEISVNLDLYDPAKGKILGIAEQELDYITSYDPARYNQDNPVLDTFQPQSADDASRTPIIFNYVGTTTAWGRSQVGQLWWNLDACRYIDYEQDSLVYRSKNWGQLFPGSTIEVCEWVESDVPPGSYTGSGTAKYVDNSAYSLEYNVNKSTGAIVTKYYFWVINKTTSNPFAANKTRTAADVANIIESPQNAGVSYAAAIRPDAFNLYGINQYISGTQTVLHIDYSLVENENIIHSEYELIKENTARSIIPTKIVDKLIDSLVGETVDYRRVPDPALPENQKIGIGSRPMQSMFKNRYTALQTFVDYVNQVMIQYPVILQFDTKQFYVASPQPSASSGKWNLKTNNYEDLGYIDKNLLPIGYKILVTADAQNDGLWTIYELDDSQNFVLKQIQEYRTDTYISEVDWYDTTFNTSQELDWVVDTLQEIEIIQSNLTSGDIILVNNEGSGRFAYYRVNTDLTTSLVGLQNGTIQIKESIYDSTVGNTAFGAGNFDNERFDRYPVEEIRNIFSAIKEDIFIKSLDTEFNKLFFTIINYLLSEQKTTDWIFKTSFISVLHKIRKLDQYPSYVRDNQTYYQDYINEVKPYRTQIREYLLDYQGNDTFNGNITDFDLPSRYNRSTGTYLSPSLADIENPEFMASLPADLKAEYINWYNNRKYQVSYIDVYDAGLGYTTDPLVSIVGGGGSGATAQSTIWQGNGSIRSITITNPGTGYTSAPTVVVNGDGTRNTGANIQLGFAGNGAILYANIVSGGTGFTGNPSIFVSGNVGTNANISCTINSRGVIDSTTIVDAGLGYDSSAVATVFDTGTNATALARINAVYYKPNPIDSYNTIRSITNKIKFDRVTFTSNITDWSANSTYYFGDTVRYQGQVYRANTTVYPSAILALGSNVTQSVGDTVVTYIDNTITGNANVSVAVTSGNIVFATNTQGILSGGLPYKFGQQTSYGASPTYSLFNVPVIAVTNVFDTTKYIKVDISDINNAADRAIGYYTPTSGMPARDLEQLYSGTGYPGVRVTGVAYEQKITTTSNVVQFFATNSTIYSNNVAELNFNYIDLAGGQTIEISGTANNNESWTINTVEDNRIIVYSTLVGVNVVDEEAGPAVNFTYYNENNPWALDTNIQSSYLDTTLGTRPEDINVVGGAYVDTYSSHAPEELVPGRMYDNLNMEVWTLMRSGTANVGYRVYHGMNNNPGTLMTLELSEAITIANTYPLATYITQVYLDSTNPQANVTLKFNDLATAEQFFGEGVGTIDIAHLQVSDYYEHDLDFYGFVATDDRTIYVNGVDTGANVVSVYKNDWPEYYTINPANTTVLTSNLNITDTEIHVADAYALPQGGTEAALPGAVIINGEKIYYYKNYAKDVVSWIANTAYASDSIVNYLGNTYVAANANVSVSGSTFNFANVILFNVHRLTQLRRATEGTGAPLVHVAGLPVVDASEQQRLTGNTHLTTWMNVPSLSSPRSLIDNTANPITDNIGNPFEVEYNTTAPGLENSSTAQAIAIRRAAGLE